jgi:nitrogen fixation/metabolism regulation signal transduction histidine kinase
MTKLSSKIAFPIILSSIFAITIFIALDYERINASFYIVLFFVAIYVFFFGYATGEKFASPVQELLERATQLTQGNLSNRIYLNTKDELAELAEVFNKLASELEESTNREKNAEKSLDIKIRAKTQSLEETINALEQKVKNRTIELERITGESEVLKQQLKDRETEISGFKQKLKSLDIDSSTDKKIPKVEN